jgi:hypothetical protein
MGVVFNELSSEADRQSYTHKFQEAEQDVKGPEVKVPGGESAGSIILCCLFASSPGMCCLSGGHVCKVDVTPVPIM